MKITTKNRSIMQQMALGAKLMISERADMVNIRGHRDREFHKIPFCHIESLIENGLIYFNSDKNEYRLTKPGYESINIRSRADKFCTADKQCINQPTEKGGLGPAEIGTARYENPAVPGKVFCSEDCFDAFINRAGIEKYRENPEISEKFWG